MPRSTRRPMTWRRVANSAKSLAAHSALLNFTVLLVLKLNNHVAYSWWTIFSPLWLFHLIISRGRFSMPAPSVPHNRHWAPCHSIVAVPLLVAFELLLCIYLESIYVRKSAFVNLKIVFLPLLAFEVIVLVDNFRMCKALMPGDDESMSDEAIWDTLPHFWVAISMVFFVAATLFTLFKLSGGVDALGWWDLFINFGIAECFSFLVCTRWLNPAIHGGSPEEETEGGICGLEDIGGHVMKIPIVGFQVLLCMRLEGTPAGARHIPIPIVFSPVLVLQASGVLLAASRMSEKIAVLLRGGSGGRRCMFKLHECFMFMQHGSRLLGWWSIDEGNPEENARLFHNTLSSGYSTFSTYPPEVVKKMPKKDLTDEVWRLQAALGEQTEIMKFTQQEYDRIQNDKILCRICYEGEISVVLLPCRHRILCAGCCEKCNKCPICRITIEERMPVYDV